MKSKIQKIIEAALNEQVLECYDALNKTFSEKLVGPVGKISESVSKRFFEGVATPKSVVRESYDAQKPEVQRAIDYVVEGITKKGVSAFESLVENAETRFGIFNDDLKNYFAEAIREDFSLKAGASKRKVQEPILNQQHFRGQVFKPTNQLKAATGRSLRGDAYRQKAKKDEYAEEFQTQPAKSILNYLKGPTSGKELADKYLGPRRKKTAAQRKAAKRLRGK